MQCYYCQKNQAVDHSVVNPMTRQAEATCRVCEYEFHLLAEDRKKFFLLAASGKALIVASLIFLILVGWQAAVVCFVVGLSLVFISISAVGKKSGQRDRQAGKFAKEHGLFSFHADRPEPEQIAWCKNCAHYRRVKGWEGMGGNYSRDTMPSDGFLPCKILSETEAVWARFFAVPSGQKRLYPTDCPSFASSSDSRR